MELQHLSLLRYRLMTTYSHFGMNGYEVLEMNEVARAPIFTLDDAIASVGTSLRMMRSNTVARVGLKPAMHALKPLQRLYSFFVLLFSYRECLFAG